jgi:hypothetical protein
MRIYHFFFVTVSFVQLADAQSGFAPFHVATPTLGYVYDSRLQAIRQIKGIPGAALVEAPMDLGFNVRAAAISAQGFALTVSADDEQVRLVRFNGSGASVSSLEKALPAPDRIIMSPSGTAAVLWQQGSNRFQVISGLPGTPGVRDVSFKAFGGPGASVAISDDGALVLLTSKNGDSGPERKWKLPQPAPRESASGRVSGERSWLIDADGNSFSLPSPVDAAMVSFQRASHDAVWLTRSGDLYVAQNIGQGAALSQIYLSGGRIVAPIAMRLSPDGTRAYAANERGEIASVDLGTGSVRVTSCQCHPSGLEPMNSPVIMKLTEVSSLPLLLFDSSEARQRVWFVPLAPAASRGAARVGSAGETSPPVATGFGSKGSFQQAASRGAARVGSAGETSPPVAAGIGSNGNFRQAASRGAARVGSAGETSPPVAAGIGSKGSFQQDHENSREDRR